jgi:cell division protein FtsB
MDLYDDLDEVQASLEVDQLRESLVAEKKAREVLEMELADTQAQLSKMVAEKEALEQNITDLYATAVMEIARKDKKIAELLARRK